MTKLDDFPDFNSALMLLLGEQQVIQCTDNTTLCAVVWPILVTTLDQMAYHMT